MDKKVKDKSHFNSLKKKINKNNNTAFKLSDAVSASGEMANKLPRENKAKKKSI